MTDSKSKQLQNILLSPLQVEHQLREYQFDQRELDKRDLFVFNYGMSKQVFNQILGKLK